MKWCWFLKRFCLFAQSSYTLGNGLYLARWVSSSCSAVGSYGFDSDRSWSVLISATTSVGAALGKNAASFKFQLDCLKRLRVQGKH